MAQSCTSEDSILELLLGRPDPADAANWYPWRSLREMSQRKQVQNWTF